MLRQGLSDALAAQRIRHAGVIDDDQMRRRAGERHFTFVAFEAGDVASARRPVFFADIHFISRIIAYMHRGVASLAQMGQGEQAMDETGTGVADAC